MLSLVVVFRFGNSILKWEKRFHFIPFSEVFNYHIICKIWLIFCSSFQECYPHWKTRIHFYNVIFTHNVPTINGMHKLFFGCRTIILLLRYSENQSQELFLWDILLKYYQISWNPFENKNKIIMTVFIHPILLIHPCSSFVFINFAWMCKVFIRSWKYWGFKGM